MIYGHANEDAAELRTFKEGMLNTTQRYGQLWLPDSPNYFKDCVTAHNPTACYKGGKNKVINPHQFQNFLRLNSIFY